VTSPVAGVLAASVFAIGAGITAFQQARAPTAEQRRVIDRGEQVFLTEAVAGSAWPRAWVLQYIDATPEEAAAVFADYSLHSTYIPNVKRSAVGRVIDPLTAEVDYVLRLPIVRDEEYTVRDRLSASEERAHYQVDWTLVRATSVRGTEGYARFERYWNDKLRREGTLLEYCNFVTPGSRLAGIRFVRSRALEQVRAAARAVGAQVERHRRENPALLRRQVGALRAALAR
jgi:hypothetical protein